MTKKSISKMKFFEILCVGLVGIILGFIVFLMLITLLDVGMGTYGYKLSLALLGLIS